jgi:hypothetical protein
LNDSKRLFSRALMLLGRFFTTALLLSCFAGMLAAPVSATAQTPASAVPELPAIKPHLRDEIAAAMPQGMPVYELGITFPAHGDPGRTLRGTMTLTYTNTTGEDIASLPFRLYANGPDPQHDALTIEEVTIDGSPAEPEMSVDNSVVTVPLPAVMTPGETTSVSMRFTTNVPLDAREHYGIFNRSGRTGTWALAHWYPVLAGRDPDSGWMLDPPSQNGDPIFSDAGMYRVTVTAPQDVQIITSGVQQSSEMPDDATRSTTFTAAPSRDFTILADDDMESVTREVAGTTVTSWYEPGHDEAGNAVADWAAQSLTVFNELLGEYPYRELYLAEVEVFGAAGVEFPQLIYMGSDYYDRQVNREEPGSFEFTVAHEVVHQWFYGMVGNHQYDHAFIDEGLTNYLSAQVYFERVYDAEAAARISGSYLEAPYESAVGSGDDEIVDTPTDDFSSSRGYVLAAYSKSPLGFAAIRETMGDDAFFGALQAYVREFRFRVATPPDLLAAFRAATDQDVQAVWTQWFERCECEDNPATPDG